jgi:hypothetical protein
MSGAKVSFMQNEEDISDLCAVDLPPLPKPCSKTSNNKPQANPYFLQSVGAATEDQSSPMDCSPD